MYTCLGTSALSFLFWISFFFLLVFRYYLGTYLPTNIIVRPVFFLDMYM